MRLLGSGKNAEGENADGGSCGAENADGGSCGAENADGGSCGAENADGKPCDGENSPLSSCIAVWPEEVPIEVNLLSSWLWYSRASLMFLQTKPSGAM